MIRIRRIRRDRPPVDPHLRATPGHAFQVVPALQTIAHIDVHPEQWDQDRWWGQPVGWAPGCGTTGCFAGWIVALAGHYIDDDGYHVRVGGARRAIPDVAAGILDLPPAHGTWTVHPLFAGHNTRTDLGRMVDALATGCDPLCDHDDHVGALATPEQVRAALAAATHAAVAAATADVPDDDRCCAACDVP